jgi:hypothetical protein
MRLRLEMKRQRLSSILRAANMLNAGCTRVEVVARGIFAIGAFDFDTVRVEFK